MAENSLGLIMSVTVQCESVGQPIEPADIRRDRAPDSNSIDPGFHNQIAGSIARVCAECGTAFTVTIGRAKLGRGICCSRPCAQRRASRAGIRRLHELFPQQGEGNFNFKSWRSKTPVVYARAFKLKNPEKLAAHRAVDTALRAKRLIRPSVCEDCGRTCKPHAHHDDYSKPLTVRWVCRACHLALDRARRAKGAAA